MPDTMRAVVQYVHGGPDTLYIESVPRPLAGPGDLLVNVRAVSVNPVDAKVRAGRGVQPGAPIDNAPRILGWDAAGVVVEVGAEASGFAVGDEVWFAGDVTRAGSFAEYVAVDARLVGRKPVSLDFEQAAALPLTALTVWESIVESLHGEEYRGGDILVVGGAGGVGSIAIQVARQVTGLRVIATASRPETAEFCRELGADLVIDHGKPLAAQLRAAGIESVPLIFSTAPLTNFSQLTECLAPFGRIGVILAGEPAAALDVSPLFHLCGTLSFEFMFTRSSRGADPARQGRILGQLAALVDDGKIRTTMTRAMSWHDVQDAHRAIDSGKTIGKIVLRID